MIKNKIQVQIKVNVTQPLTFLSFFITKVLFLICIFEVQQFHEINCINIIVTFLSI